MTVRDYRIRRATADDIPQLHKIWKAAGLSAGVLEQRFTEFQVIEGNQGELIGAMGLKIAGRYGWLHSETIPDFALADALRPILWDRLKNVATHNNLVRLWTREPARFWREQDFASATQDQLAKRPAAFGGESGGWWTFKLKDEVSVESLVNDEFAQLQEMHAREREKNAQRIKALKIVGFAVIAVFIGILLVCFVFFVKFKQQTGR